MFSTSNLSQIKLSPISWFELKKEFTPTSKFEIELYLEEASKKNIFYLEESPIICENGVYIEFNVLEW